MSFKEVVETLLNGPVRNTSARIDESTRITGKERFVIVRHPSLQEDHFNYLLTLVLYVWTMTSGIPYTGSP